MTRKVLQVDEIVLSAEQLLRMMVNREGAHSNPNETLIRSSHPTGEGHHGDSLR